MQTHPLTARQFEVCEALKRFVRINGRPPGVRALARYLGKSPATVHMHLQALVRKQVVVKRSSSRYYHWPEYRPL